MLHFQLGTMKKESSSSFHNHKVSMKRGRHKFITVVEQYPPQLEKIQNNNKSIPILA
jgi:hypothetical protein